MLKRFFYASAAVLMLAIAYHLGASTARAQGPGGTIVGIAGEGGGRDDFLGVMGNGDTQWSFDGGMTWEPRANALGGVAGEQVASVAGFGGGKPWMMVVSTTGSVYVTVDEGATWQLRGVVPGGVTLVRDRSFGSIKASFR